MQCNGSYCYLQGFTLMRADFALHLSAANESSVNLSLFSSCKVIFEACEPNLVALQPAGPSRDGAVR